jgi:hypothetical protein
LRPPSGSTAFGIVLAVFGAVLVIIGLGVWAVVDAVSSVF